MRQALITFTIFCALAFAVTAQQPKLETAEMPTVVPTLKIEGAALTELALAQTRLQSAQQALQAAELNLQLVQVQILTGLGGSLLDYTPQARVIDPQGTWGFVAKSKGGK